MSSPKDTQREYLKTLDRVAKRLAAMFAQAFARIAKGAPVSAITAAVEAHDVERIILLLDIRPAAFSQVTEELRKATIEGGITAQVTARADFNAADPLTAERLAKRSSALVTDIIQSQREAIREALAAGAGRNPRSVALDIVGRVSRATGRREGGIVGLTGQQSGYVSNARVQLEALDASYFTRTRRDKRFDGAVRRAIADDKPLSKTQIEKITGRYSDRLLKSRGDTIARTETLSALNLGRQEAINQAVDSGKISPENVKKKWQTAMDGDVRDSHAFMNGQVVKHGEPFISGDGNYLMYPGDPSAPIGETANCRCISRQDIDFLAEELG